MKIPEFKNESEEADWWYANRKNVDREFRNANPVTDASGKLMTPAEIVAAHIAAQKQPQFEQAPTTGIEKHQAIADDFMRQIFEMEPDEYLITDESMLGDFADFGDDSAMPEIRAKVQSIYGDVVQENTDYLITIFRRIAE